MEEDVNATELANLVMILKLFNNNPYYLAQFLLDNQALTPSFRQKIQDSQALSRIKREGFTYDDLYFPNIEKMKNYFDSLLHDNLNISEKINEVTAKLKIALNQEDYKSAIRYRDYIYRLNQKK